MVFTVLKEASDLSEKRDFPWLFDVGEFPVEINRKETKIDFILKNIKLPLHLVS